MRKYLIIGNGRLAQHICHYFSILNIPTLNWSRKNNTEDELIAMAKQADRILILISDSAIVPFLEQRPYLQEKVLIHCSGVLNTLLAECAHPLMTFTKELYPREVYLNIPFITISGRANLSDMIPDIHNVTYILPPEKKSFYHAFCVMSVNFTTILWENAFEVFEKELKLPRQVLLPCLERVLQNAKQDPTSNLTGPIQRGDVKTMVHNLEALNSRPEQSLYYAFLNFYLQKNKIMGNLNYEHLHI